MTINETLDSVSEIRNAAEIFAEKYRGSDAKIFLFGTGICGHSQEKILSRYGVRIEGFIDNYKTEINDLPYPLFKLDEVLKKYDKEECVIVISAPAAKKEIYSQLTRVFDPEQVHIMDITRLVFEWNEPSVYKKFLSDNKKYIAELYDSLADSKSKEVLIGTINGYLSGVPRFFDNIRSGEFYQPSDIIRFGENEVMAEIGSNNGDTFIDFARRCPDFKRAYCFEPDPLCLKELEKATRPFSERVCIVPMGAWSEKRKLVFNSYGECLKTSMQGCFVTNEKADDSVFELNVTTVDEEVSENITYMKMDIEGSELEALKGAAGQIKRNRPRLAVSIYHRFDDIMTIPLFLKSLVPDYRFYIRHHGADDTDTVLYALS